ncbi:MAG TPA: hypothetical protein VHX66_05350 [Solirubrobacteraceae bacterium]|jgi:hypothetical protein|nr:hypothetical protein [Solirubrobacteraceae bacterium]
MRGPDPIGADGRRARARRSVPAGAVCVACGENDPRVLQAHHVAGLENDRKLTVVLCLNHHHLNTLGQLDLGVERSRDRGRHEVERLVNLLRGHAGFFTEDARALTAAADGLETFVRMLDTHCPSWREMPVAD